MVREAVKATGEFAEPIWKAYELEGSKNFNAPRQVGGPLANTCHKGGCADGSPWTISAQLHIAGEMPEGWSFDANNHFVDASAAPYNGKEYHVPVITAGDPAGNKTGSTTTYSQCNWDLSEKEDTGFVYTSASEIATKTCSRQCALIKGAGEKEDDVPFTVDDPNFCKEINMKAYQHALDSASSEAIERYNKFGQPYIFGDDIYKGTGITYLDSGLVYKDKGDDGVEISAPMLKTDKNYWPEHFGPIPKPGFLPDPGCMHYCKLLSPARAMEWIYVDGLRRHMPIESY